MYEIFTILDGLISMFFLIIFMLWTHGVNIYIYLDVAGCYIQYIKKKKNTIIRYPGGASTLHKKLLEHKEAFSQQTPVHCNDPIAAQ